LGGLKDFNEDPEDASSGSGNLKPEAEAMKKAQQRINKYRRGILY